MQTKAAQLVAVVILLVANRQVHAQFVFGERENLGPNINGPSSEDQMTLSADGLTIYFVSGASWEGGGKNSDIYVAERECPGCPWGEPESLGSLVNSASYEGMPNISRDELALYFSDAVSGTEATPHRRGGLGKGDLWVTTRDARDAAWREPENKGVLVNVNSSYKESDPTISADGLTLFFASDRPGGFGGPDVWMSTRPGPGAPWGEPINLGSGVNTSARDGATALSTDGLTLFFHSQFRSRGWQDLWVATRPSTDAGFGPAFQLTSISTAEPDIRPVLAADGSMLFFGTKATEGHGDFDLYQVPILAWPPSPRFAVAIGEAGAPFELRADGALSTTAEGHTIVSYEWDFGDGEIAEGVTATHTYNRPGRFFVSLTVTDDQELSWTNRQAVSVGCPPGDISPWIAADVGEPLIPGAARIEDATGERSLSLCASGKSLSGRQDSFHFVHQEYSGDTVLTTQVMSMEGGLSGAQVGLMLRESLDPDARFAAMSLRSATRFRFNYRDAMEGTSRLKNGPRGVELPNAWVKIERQGDEFIASASIDGVTWEEVSRRTIAGFPEEFHGGFFATGGEPRDASPFDALEARVRLEDPPVFQTFIRGDANADGGTDVSDGVFVLNFLFSGDSAPSCVKSADANDSGGVDVSDGVYLLNHLFAGGPPPPAPFSECGVDPTPDETECEAYGPCTN